MTARAGAIVPPMASEVLGFEVKVDRRDWLREQKDPAKAEAIARFCDRWWLVASEEKIVAPGELPPAWGLMVPKGEGLRIVTDATKLEAMPLSRVFLGAILRAVHSQSATETQLAQARKDGVAEGIERGKEAARHEGRLAGDGALALKKSVAAFEAASGVSIDNWNGPNIGEAVAKVQQLYRADYRKEVERIVEQLDTVKADLRASLKATEEPR